MVNLLQCFVIKNGYIGNILKYFAFWGPAFLLKDPE